MTLARKRGSRDHANRRHARPSDLAPAGGARRAQPAGHRPHGGARIAGRPRPTSPSKAAAAAALPWVRSSARDTPLAPALRAARRLNVPRSSSSSMRAPSTSLAGGSPAAGRYSRGDRSDTSSSSPAALAHQRPVQHVAQLADVARPGVRGQHGHRLRRHPIDLVARRAPPAPPGRSGRSAAGTAAGRSSRRSRSGGRRMRDDGQPLVEVGAELAARRSARADRGWWRR